MIIICDAFILDSYLTISCHLVHKSIYVIIHIFHIHKYEYKKTFVNNIKIFRREYDEDNIRESSFGLFGTIIKPGAMQIHLYTSESSEASLPMILDAVEDDVLGRCKSEEGTIHSTVEFHMVPRH